VTGGATGISLRVLQANALVTPRGNMYGHYNIILKVKHQIDDVSEDSIFIMALNILSKCAAKGCNLSSHALKFVGAGTQATEACSRLDQIKQNTIK
jgi:hypothetical protein